MYIIHAYYHTYQLQTKEHSQNIKHMAELNKTLEYSMDPFRHWNN